MKKLLQINVEANFGSTGRIAENIGELVIKNDWISCIAYGRKFSKSSSRLIPIGNKVDHLMHVMQTRVLDRHGLASKIATKNLIKKIQDLQPSIIHLHNIHGYYLNYELLFAYFAAITTPIVWTIHDCWPITGHCTHFEDIGCEKWKKTCNNCPQLNVYPQSWGRDRSTKNQLQKKISFGAHNNLTIVSVSEWLSKIVQKSFLSGHKSLVIPNGIDTQVFSPKLTKKVINKYNLKDKFVILGVASVWSVKKGLKDFISLAKLLSSDEIIVLVGLNKEQLNSLPTNIIGIERTDSVSELAEFYATADVYVNTSLEESFGLTNAEALACGTPIIVYNATASPEMVVSEVGFVTRKNEIQELFKNIEKVEQKGKNYFTEACRNRALKNYDKNTTFHHYLDLYNRLISTV